MSGTKRARSISPDLLEDYVPLERLYPSAGPVVKGKKGEPAPEKRLKLYKRGEFQFNFPPLLRFSSNIVPDLACPKATQERVERVMSQRFFCIGRTRTSEITEEFKVLGSTGNVYTIRVCHVPTCDCPDGQRGNHCKHIVRSCLTILPRIPLPVFELTLYYFLFSSFSYS